MNKRHYQLFALAILIGAPLLISLVTSAIPGLQAVAPMVSSEPQRRPDYEQPVIDPTASLPKPLAAPLPNQQQNGQQSGAAFDAAPTLDTAGIPATPFDQSSVAAAPQSPASAPQQSSTASPGAGVSGPPDPSSGLTEEEQIARRGG